jgi:hypothetical protein
MKLALACDDAVSHQLFKMSFTTDYPLGDATAACAALQNRWAPKKEVDKQTVLTKLFALKLEDVHMDPETWIIDLQELQAKMREMNERVSDGILIAHLLANLPKEYDNVADQLARDQNKTITSVSNELKQKYERMNSAGDINENTEKSFDRIQEI